jgi:hypothetical protein
MPQPAPLSSALLTPPPRKVKAANAQAAVDQFRANTAVVIWAAGCLAGVVLAAVLDLRLLSAVGAGVNAT